MSLNLQNHYGHTEVLESEITNKFKKPDGMPQADYEKIVFDRMMKKFSRKVSKAGIIRDYMEKTYFEKPSQKKHRKQLEARKALRKSEMEVPEKRDFDI